METRGALIRRRREELRQSQIDLASVAGVARATVGNVERDAGEPERRTLLDIALVLGWQPNGTLDALTEGREPYSLLPPDVLQRILEIIKIVRTSDKADEKIFRQTADAYVEFMRLLAGLGGDLATAIGGREFRRFAGLVLIRLSQSNVIDERVLETFKSAGWSGSLDPRDRASTPPHNLVRAPGSYAPEVLEELREIKDVLADQAQFLNEMSDAALAYYRLPASIQVALSSGEILDTTSFTVTDADKRQVTFVGLMILPKKGRRRAITQHTWVARIVGAFGEVSRAAEDVFLKWVQGPSDGPDVVPAYSNKYLVQLAKDMGVEPSDETDHIPDDVPLAPREDRDDGES